MQNSAKQYIKPLVCSLWLILALCWTFHVYTGARTRTAELAEQDQI